MPVYFAAPNVQRQGVVAGFVLEAPVYGGVAQGAGMVATFPIFNWNVTVTPATDPNHPQQTYSIANGFVHTVQIGGRTYSYVQQPATGTPNNTDTSQTIAQALVNAINGAGDPEAVATYSATSSWSLPGVGVMASITLTPRADTGAAIAWSSEGGMFSGQLIELTGLNNIPALTAGVLFAQGVMYAPSPAPALTQPTALSASGQSWLWYNSAAGFYWTATDTPTVSDDAFIGWVMVNESRLVYGATSEIVAVCARRVGTGAEAVILPGGAVALNIGAAAATDTGVPPGPGLALSTNSYDPTNEATPGLLMIHDLGWPTLQNVAGVYSLFFLIFYIDELSGPAAYLTAAMTPAATGLPGGPYSLPVAAPEPVVFTFSATSTGGITIGVGYAHNITIGEAQYIYVQQTGDSAATIAAELAALVQAAVDANATATASGAAVILTPLGTSGATVACTASDGNAAATLTETQPSYYLIENEIIQVLAANGSSVVRAQGGSPLPMASHPTGAPIWQVKAMPVWVAHNGALAGTAAAPDPIIEIPFRDKGLVAMDWWATNEFGNSPYRGINESYSLDGGRMRGLGGGQLDFQVSGVLAIGADQCPAVTVPLKSSIASITATVKGAPVGNGITININLPGVASPWATVTIASGATTATMGMWTGYWSAGTVDGLVIPAGQAVTLDVTGVGSTYPGNDLTVTVAF